MAEGGGVDVTNTLPERGKVQHIRQEWAVHEDGAFAYQLQNEEIDLHYGLNRFNRRTVREDIPIAKVVQTDEEIQQQNERFQQLQALRAQAEEDAKVAKQMLEQEQLQLEAHRVARELTDEEFARTVQEKEKQRYERHLEKKKLQKLKQERAQIEQSLLQKSEEAGLKPATGSPNTSVEQLEGSPATRVTPLGQIEDDGDFSDFYNLPQNVDPSHRQVLQEIQDEELAKLLQDQEHKRSKAEVDRAKLREIEEQDKRLAEIIQEQEKIKLRKAKQKKKQQEEARRSQQVQRPPALPPRNSEHDHRRYRRNSFILSMENGPSDGENSSLGEGPDGYVTAAQVSAEQRLQAQSHQSSVGSRSGCVPSDGAPGALNNSRTMGNQSRDNRQTVPKVANSNSNPRGPQGTRRPLPDYPGPPLPSHEMPDVERWLASQPPDATRGRLRSNESDVLPDSPPGSYHSEDAFPYGSPRHNVSVDHSSHYAVSAPFNFNNIAAAIDPTYTPRESDRTQGLTSTVTRALPQEVCTEIEWEPELNGSLRKGSLSRLNHTAPCNRRPDRTINTGSSRGESYHDDGPGVVSPFMPVQGQRRGPDKSRRSKRPESAGQDKNKNSSCKQQ